MDKKLDPAILQQLLHRALGMIGTVALSTVVILNWILAHLENDWTMPPEVESAFQALLTSVGILWIFRHFGLAALRADSGTLVDGTVPPQPSAAVQPPGAKP